MSRERIICGLDIGSHTIKASVLKVKDNQDVELMGIYEHSTYGFKDFFILDLSEFIECIHVTLHELSKKLGIKIKEVNLGIGGDLVLGRETSTVIPLVDRGSKVIGARDIRCINKQARLLAVKMDEEILHDLSLNYLIDDSNVAINPLGLYGRKLGVSSLMIIAGINSIRSIEKAVSQAGVEIDRISFGSYAASEIVLSEKDIKEGCILIDIGAKITSVLFFKDRVLQHFKSIKKGSEDITRGIAVRLQVPFDLAEEIKKNYASASIAENEKQEEILIKRDSQYVPLNRGDLYDAIEPEMEHLINSIKDLVWELDEAGDFRQGLVFIGGGSLLPGLIEKIGLIVDSPARLGRVQLNLPKQLSSPAIFSSVVGCAYSALNMPVLYGSQANEKTGWLKTSVNKFKELYHEYF